MRCCLLALLAVLALLSLYAFGQDWPQFHGPQRNGIAPNSPALVEQFSKENLKLVWTSEEILGSSAGGYGSVAVAEGKAFVYVNHSFNPPYVLLKKPALDGMGFDPGMSADLAKAVEDARASEERKQIKDPKAIDQYVNAWIEANLKQDQQPFKKVVAVRLKADADAIAWDVLAKLPPIVDRRFETKDLAIAWFKENAIPDNQHNRLLDQMAGEKLTEDFVYCLDAADGKTLWKKPLDGNWFYFPDSCTPTIAGGRCYVWNSQGIIYCLDAGNGSVIWKSEALGPAGFHHNRSSSVLLIDELAVVPADGGLAAVKINDGSTAWVNKKITEGQQSSAAIWQKDGKNWVLVNANSKLCLVDPSDGSLKWSVPCSEFAMPQVVGDYAALCAGEKMGLVLCKLSTETAEVLWKVPMKDTHTGPIITDKFVYAIGDAYQAPKKGHAVCVEIATGAVKWDQPFPAAQLASPVLADGKIFAVSGKELVGFKADEVFTSIGSADLSLDPYCSPTIANGRLLVRTPKNVACYDLNK